MDFCVAKRRMRNAGIYVALCILSQTFYHILLLAIPHPPRWGTLPPGEGFLVFSCKKLPFVVDYNRKIMGLWPLEDTMATLIEEISRRRTFAIISHPDAGKTTLLNSTLSFFQYTFSFR